LGFASDDIKNMIFVSWSWFELI